MKSISLYCTEGSANKEYHVDLLAKDAGFVVNFRYGPRGKALKPGTKTESPVSIELATKVYDKLVAEKMGKGYTPDVSGAAYSNTPNAGRVSGWRAALLTPVNESDVQALLDSSHWMGSEKKDGERRGVEIAIDEIRGMNRKGLYVGVPAKWSDTLSLLPNGTIVDAEHIGDTLFIFDCPQLGARDLRNLGYKQRYEAITMALAGLMHPKSGVTIVPASTDPATKRAMLKAITAAKGEGFVLRRVDGPYEAGVSPGSVKFKLYEESTCIVSKLNIGVRSVALSLLDEANGNFLVGVGNVTIPPNQAVPSVGDLVEVRYMHMFEGGSLYQPVYKGKRTDLDVSAAKLSQVTRIKPKNAESSEDDADDAGPVSATVAPEPAPRRMRM